MAVSAQPRRPAAEFNAALKCETGFGEALGHHLENDRRPALRGVQPVVRGIPQLDPVTVHVAIGTDTPHTHPSANGEALGRATHHDFRLLCALVKDIDDGGVYLNVGSAVVLPEVFLKAVSAVRNLGNPLTNFTTVNFDFLQHYRPS